MNHRELDDWKLIYNAWRPEEQPLREALCTLGNGYFATRGAFEEVSAGGVHYPGTYLAGGYNRLESEVAGRIIENEDLVNWPNWLGLTFRIEGGEWFAIDTVALESFRQALDLKRGILERQIQFRDEANRSTTIVSRRLVHMANPHLAGIAWTITAHNWSGKIEIRSALDGTVTNDGVKRYRGLNAQHLETLETGRIGEDGIFLNVRTNQSRVEMTQAARTRVYLDGTPAPVDRETQESAGGIAHLLTAEIVQEKPLRIEKIVAVHTSRDHAISNATTAAHTTLTHAGAFEELLIDHTIAWRQIWEHADIRVIDGNSYAQLVLRLHIFHLMQTVSLNSVERDVGVPARGLHGEAYRGHIFWDEIFIFPFLNLRFPELTRSLLMYRYRRLNAARHLAAEHGYEGAMYPWQSGSSGREESQVLHLNPKSGRWIPDNTHLQRHINGAVAYNVWRYFQAAHDIEFLTFYGAEMLLEIARFWASIASFNADRGRYEIHHVVGPDEFHTQYPGSNEPGLNNNAYTNVMAAWNLQIALEALNYLGDDRRAELVETLNITDDDLVRWDEISRKMFVPFHEEGIISQFEGYDALQEFDWEAYEKKYGDIQRLDRILEAENDTVNRYKASKQADVVMLFQLFTSEELSELFERLEYAFDTKWIPRNIEYYMKRVSHGSTLSRIVHSWVLSRSDRARSWQLFCNALASDIEDIQGGTTAEGIHLGAMAGTVELLQRVYAGIETRNEVLWLNPCLPDELEEVRLRVRYRGIWLQLNINKHKAHVVVEKCWSTPAQVGFRGEIHTLQQGEQREFALGKRMDSNATCD